VLFPALSARAMLEGMSARGLERDLLIADAGLDRVELERKDGELPAEAFERLWVSAQARAGRETLALEVGLSVPYGAFGALDFLAGTSDTVVASLRSLASYFATASRSFRLEIDETPECARVRIVGDPGAGTVVVSDLFTLGVLLGRFRALTDGALHASLDVCAPTPADVEAFRRVAGTPVHFERKVSAFEITGPSYAATRLRSADPRLHETLRELAGKLDLGTAGTDLERALRARLRSALPQRRADAESMARALGVSERTLQRRLEEAGQTFSAVLEAFRHEEALRLLDDRRLSLAEIAARLGFSEQSSFNRAFKRWAGRSPAASRRKPSGAWDRSR
jgi:AraC-like DNA-binding protein